MKRVFSVLAAVMVLTASPMVLNASDTCSACGVGSCGGSPTACMVQGNVCLYAEFEDGSSFSQANGKVVIEVVPCE